MLNKNANLCAEEINSCRYISVHGGTFHRGWTKQSLFWNLPPCTEMYHTSVSIIKVIHSKAKQMKKGLHILLFSHFTSHTYSSPLKSDSELSEDSESEEPSPSTYMHRCTCLNTWHGLIPFVYVWPMSRTSGSYNSLFAAVFLSNLNMNGCVLQVDRFSAIENILSELPSCGKWLAHWRNIVWRSEKPSFDELTSALTSEDRRMLALTGRWTLLSAPEFKEDGSRRMELKYPVGSK